MAAENPLYYLPGVRAGADLSAKQYHGVKYSASRTVVAATAGVCDGVLQNTPSVIGQAAAVCVFGPCKVKLAGTVSAGNILKTDTNGQFVAATPAVPGAATVDSIAIANEDGVANDIIQAYITPKNKVQE